MTGIGEWLKQVILVVLLAAFADMLLPTKAMQKYVRVVMGLAVIAVMLQPMSVLFQAGWADRVASYAASELLGATDVSSGRSSVSSPVDFQKTLHDEQEQQADAQVAQQLQLDIQSSLHVTPLSIQVSGVSSGSPTVHITLAWEDRGHANEVTGMVASELKIPTESVFVGT